MILGEELAWEAQGTSLKAFPEEPEGAARKKDTDYFGTQLEPL